MRSVVGIVLAVMVLTVVAICLICCDPSVEPISTEEAELSLELENMPGVSDSTREAYLAHMEKAEKMIALDTSWITETIRLEMQMMKEYKADLKRRALEVE